MSEEKSCITCQWSYVKAINGEVSLRCTLDGELATKPCEHYMLCPERGAKEDGNG